MALTVQCTPPSALPIPISGSRSGHPDILMSFCSFRGDDLTVRLLFWSLISTAILIATLVTFLG
ncbi:MAG TPA: hypothetical protein PLI79_22260 [Mycobacterium sp.]|nr:hypothetical protein [Mycobacterium sp.]HRD14580.1 hypothetical protein [Mycobacterium sp.]